MGKTFWCYVPDSDITATSRGHTGYSIKERYKIQFVPQIVSMKQNSFPQNKCSRGKWKLNKNVQ